MKNIPHQIYISTAFSPESAHDARGHLPQGSALKVGEDGVLADLRLNDPRDCIMFESIIRTSLLSGQIDGDKYLVAKQA